MILDAFKESKLQIINRKLEELTDLKYSLALPLT